MSHPPLDYLSPARRRSAQTIFVWAVLRAEMGVQVIQSDVTHRGFYLDFFLPGAPPGDFQGRVDELYCAGARSRSSIRGVERLRQNAVDWCKLRGQHLRASLWQLSERHSLSLAAFEEHLEPCSGPVATQVGSLALVWGEFVPVTVPIGDYRQPAHRIQMALLPDRKSAHRFRQSLKIGHKKGLFHRELGKSQGLFDRLEIGDTPIWIWHRWGSNAFGKLKSWWARLQSARGVGVLRALEFRREIGAKSPQSDALSNSSLFDLAARELASCPGDRGQSGVQRVGALELLREHLQPGQEEGLLSAQSFTRDTTWIFCAKEHLLLELQSIVQTIEAVVATAGFEGIWRCDFHRIGGKKSDRARKQLDTFKESLAGARYPQLLDDSAVLANSSRATILARCRLGQWWPLGFVQIHHRTPCSPRSRARPQRVLTLQYSLFGSLERFFALMLERCGGHLPLWMAPRQVVVLARQKSERAAALQVLAQLVKRGIEADMLSAEGEIGAKSPGDLALGADYLATADSPPERGSSLRVWQRNSGTWQRWNAGDFAAHLTLEIANQAQKWQFEQRV